MLLYFLSLGLRFTWVCRDIATQYVLDDLLELTSAIPSPSESNLDRGGCYGTGAGKIGSNDSLLQINSGFMVENSSYLITVVVERGRRRANYTQEVVIVPGDPPEVMIMYVKFLPYVMTSPACTRLTGHKKVYFSHPPPPPIPITIPQSKAKIEAD